MTNVLDDNFFAKLNHTIEEANKKQTLEIKKEIEHLKESIQEEAKKRSELEGKYEALKEKYAQLEKCSRKNNIIIFGLENTEEKLVDYVIRTLNTCLSLNLDCRDIDDVFFIDINKNRTNKIIIAEQLSPDQIKTQKILRRHLNEARSRKILAYIKGEKIYINGDAYTAEELQERAVNVNEEETKEQEGIDDQLLPILGSNSAPSTPTAVKNKKEGTAEIDRLTGNYQKKTKTTTGLSTVQTRTSGRKQEEKTKQPGTPSENKIGLNRNKNREDEGKN